MLIFIRQLHFLEEITHLRINRKKADAYSAGYIYLGIPRGWAQSVALEGRTEIGAKRRRVSAVPGGRSDATTGRHRPETKMEADNVPGGTGATAPRGKTRGHDAKSPPNGGLFHCVVVPAGHDPATP